MKITDYVNLPNRWYAVQQNLQKLADFKLMQFSLASDYKLSTTEKRPTLLQPIIEKYRVLRMSKNFPLVFNGENIDFPTRLITLLFYRIPHGSLETVNCPCEQRIGSYIQTRQDWTTRTYQIRSLRTLMGSQNSLTHIEEIIDLS
jgi:hypothetical protein